MRLHQSIAASLAGLAVCLGVLAQAGEKVIYQTHSRYNHIIVKEDTEGLRYLYFSEDGAQQSVRRPGEVDRLELPYSRVMMLGLACVEEPERILVLGLGGASIPTFLHNRYPRARIDCVDIDSEVIDVAKRFFGFNEDENLKVHPADGRKFIESAKGGYDLIFLDAYGDDAIPRHLATREFLEAVRRALSPKGVVLGNVWSRSSNRLYDSMVRTYQAVFPQLHLFRVPARGNVIFLAIPREGELSVSGLARRAREVSRRRKLGFDLEHLVRVGHQNVVAPANNAPVLKDLDPN